MTKMTFLEFLAAHGHTATTFCNLPSAIKASILKSYETGSIIIHPRAK